MSSLRAIQLPTEPVFVVETQAYIRPRIRAAVAPWKHDVEALIRIVGRLGLGPIPTAVLGFVLVAGIASRPG